MANNNIHILSLNAGGLYGRKKRFKVIEWLKKTADIVMLQETHFTRDLEFELKSVWGKEYDMWFSNCSSQRAGVALIIKQGVLNGVHGVHFGGEGRFIVMDCTIRELRVVLVNLYAPNETDTSDFFRNIFEKEMIFPSTSKLKYKTYIIGGDFNVIFDPKLDRTNATALKEKTTDYIIKFMNDNNIIDVWRKIYPFKKSYTYYKSKEATSRIDYIFVSDILKISSAEILEDVKLSDHRPVSMKIDLPTTSEVYMRRTLEEFKIAYDSGTQEIKKIADDFIKKEFPQGAPEDGPEGHPVDAVTAGIGAIGLPKEEKSKDEPDDKLQEPHASLIDYLE